MATVLGAPQISAGLAALRAGVTELEAHSEVLTAELAARDAQLRLAISCPPRGRSSRS